MLKRMYTRWCDKKKYTYEVLDEQEGLEAGIKSTTMIIHGLYAYGYLKCEKGIHRLVRISPFDSGARRHTSFASIDIVPLIENSKIDRKEYTHYLADVLTETCDNQFKELSEGQLDAYDTLFQQPLKWYRKIEQRLKKIEIKK